MSDVVVVESPAKAKTINRYLGGGYTVLASLGHVRDLPPKDGSVLPEQDFAMAWTVDERGERQVGAIAKALKGAEHAVSWPPTRIARVKRSPGTSRRCWPIRRR